MYRLKINKFYTYIHTKAYQNHIENIFSTLIFEIEMLTFGLLQTLIFEF